MRVPGKRFGFFSAVIIIAFLVGCAEKPAQREAAFLRAGQKHYQAGDFGRAILDFKNAAQAMPMDAEPHYQLGLVQLDSGNPQAAANELIKAVDLNPKHIAAQLKLAELMAANRNLDV